MSDMDLLRWWDGTRFVNQPPFKTFFDEDGDWVALWWWPDPDDTAIAGAERVIFTPETFEVETYVDVMELYADDPPLDEDDEPYYTEWGQEFSYESVVFDKDAFAEFLKDVITGRLVYERVPRTIMRPVWKGPGHPMSDTEMRPVRIPNPRWAPAPRVPFKKKPLPRTREQMAMWVLSAGIAAISAGSTGGDYVDELPEGVPEM